MTEYVIHGTAPWTAPWLTEHNLAYALAGRHPVLFMEPPATPLTPLRQRPRGRLADYGRLLRRRRTCDRVSIATPIVLPPQSHRRARAMSAPLLRAQIGGAARAAGLLRPVTVATHSYPGVIEAARGHLLVYLVKDWIADGAALLGRGSEELLEGQERLCSAADLVCATSYALQRRLGEIGVDSMLLRHGFASDLVARFDDPRPAALSDMTGPLLGYAGRIDGRIDFELLVRVSERFYSGTVVLVGPVSPRVDPRDLELLRARPNVRLLPAVSRTELPSYLTALDCCLMPYRPSEWIRHAAPLKLWDYLYAGAPLVGCGCEALADLPDRLAVMARSDEEFLQAVGRALDSGRTDSNHRRSFALANTWDHRAHQLHDAVERLAEGC